MRIHIVIHELYIGWGISDSVGESPYCSVHVLYINFPIIGWLPCLPVFHGLVSTIRYMCSLKINIFLN
jgi:hypothetical protein